jgi:hypothetical protein
MIKYKIYRLMNKFNRFLDIQRDNVNCALCAICSITIYLVFGIKYWCGIIAIIVFHTILNS